MAINQVISHLRRVALIGAGQSDGQLLTRFIDARDEAAFEALVRRHGPMVFRTCCRVLRNYADADDAFQATFLVLVRKAASVKPPEMVGNWLYGVAHQTAIRVKAMNAKRYRRERQVTALPDMARPDSCDDLTCVLDEGLSRLPTKYRIPIVLCDLEGRSRKEVAKQLGWAEGSLSSRLARGRAMLARRLAKHGFVPSSGALASVLSQNAASASASPALVSTVVKAAAAWATDQPAAAALVSAKVATITQGVLTSMFLTKVKTVAVVSLLCALGLALGASFLAAQASGEGQPSERRAGQGNKPRAGGTTNPNEQNAKLADLERRLAQSQAVIAELREQIQALQKEGKIVEKRDGGMLTRTFSARHIAVSDVASVLESLFNEAGQPRSLRIGVAKSISSIIVQGSEEDLEKAAQMVDQLEAMGQAFQRRQGESGVLKGR